MNGQPPKQGCCNRRPSRPPSSSSSWSRAEPGSASSTCWTSSEDRSRASKARLRLGKIARPRYLLAGASDSHVRSHTQEQPPWLSTSADRAAPSAGVFVRVYMATLQGPRRARMASRRARRAEARTASPRGRFSRGQVRMHLTAKWRTALAAAHAATGPASKASQAWRAVAKPRRCGQRGGQRGTVLPSGGNKSSPSSARCS